MTKIKMQNWNVEVDCKVKGGFPVIVMAWVNPPDRTTGFDDEFITDIAVLTTRHTTLPFELSEDDMLKCELAVFERMD